MRLVDSLKEYILHLKNSGYIDFIDLANILAYLINLYFVLKINPSDVLVYCPEIKTTLSDINLIYRQAKKDNRNNFVVETLKSKINDLEEKLSQFC